jgi:hypothetical protein
MADAISGAALVIAIFSGLSSFITTLHIRQCNICWCIKSDCNKTPPNTPEPFDKVAEIIHNIEPSIKN